jgi:DedD protein
LQDHLKERITGAAILVVVVVLLVPEMFRGPQPTRLKSGTAAAAGPPVRSYTIDLRDSAEGAAPAASAPADATSAGAEDSAPAKETASAPSASAPPRAASSAPPPAAQPAAPVSAAPTPAQPAGAVKSGWTVQVGSFARRDYAERMVKQVAAKGFTVEVAGPDDRGLYRVRSAPQPQRAAAVALKQKMQASGLKPIVNTVP